MKWQFRLWATLLLMLFSTLMGTAQPAFAKAPAPRRPISRRAPAAQRVIIYEFHADT